MKKTCRVNQYARALSTKYVSYRGEGCSMNLAEHRVYILMTSLEREILREITPVKLISVFQLFTRKGTALI